MSALQSALDTLRCDYGDIGLEIDSITLGERLMINACRSEGMITFNFDIDEEMSAMSGIELKARINNFDDPDYDFNTDPAYQDSRDNDESIAFVNFDDDDNRYIEGPAQRPSP